VSFSVGNSQKLLGVTSGEEQLQSCCRQKTGEPELPNEEERFRDERTQLQPFWAVFHAMLEETS